MGMTLKMGQGVAAKVAELTERRIKAVVQEAAREMHAEAVKGTPKKTGRLAAAWNVGVGKVDARVPRKSKNPQPVSDPEAALAQVKDDSEVHVSNNVTYALKIENGGKKQAPRAMGRNAFNTVVARMDQIVEKAKKSAG